ncbi:MAG: hypothetical protein HPY50_10905 [Firmicutes bacterium]|nr:hypothetical protein [Bacillota bacterium]
MFCETCGEKLLGASSFCVGCGSKIGSPGPVAHQAAAQETLPPVSMRHSSHTWTPPVGLHDAREREPLTTGQYLLMFLLLSLPLLNLVLLFKWSFWPGGNINRRNFARASLVVFLIMFGFYILVYRYMAGEFH